MDEDKVPTQIKFSYQTKRLPQFLSFLIFWENEAHETQPLTSWNIP
jgi:hypothetical protein